MVKHVQVKQAQPQNEIDEIRYYLPPENNPVSPWGYLGLKLLFAIPIVGLILLIVFSFNSNVNIKNYARAFWCELLLVIIVLIILIISGASQEIVENAISFFDNLY